MAFLFGIFAAWFVMASALFIKDSGKHKALSAYALWPRNVWRTW